MERQLLFSLRYHGGAYHGFQVQQNARSVAQTIQDAVEQVFGERLPIKGCSRTDAGVHANAFALSLNCTQAIPCDAAVQALNHHLPDDIAIFACREVPDDFHVRYSCTGKCYVYRIYNAPARNPFYEGLALHHKYPLDIPAMHAAAQAFLGTHDFSSFCASGSSVTDPVRTMTGASVTQTGHLVEFHITGSGFLYNMVRIMAGTLLDAGRGKRDAADIADVIAKKNRALAGVTAPAHGLYLDAIFYPDFTIA